MQSPLSVLWVSDDQELSRSSSGIPQSDQREVSATHNKFFAVISVSLNATVIASPIVIVLQCQHCTIHGLQVVQIAM